MFNKNTFISVLIWQEKSIVNAVLSYNSKLLL